MIDYDTDEEAAKQITMIASLPDGRTINITEAFSEDASWPEIAYQFYCFLAAMGYRLSPEDVQADYGQGVL